MNAQGAPDGRDSHELPQSAWRFVNQHAEFINDKDQMRDLRIGGRSRPPILGEIRHTGSSEQLLAMTDFSTEGNKSAFQVMLAEISQQADAVGKACKRSQT
ncbi:hypothetical protein D3C73_888550 [compost metagenome]